MKSVVSALIICMLTSASVLAMDAKPGKGIKVSPARATWNTGYFQEALVRAALTELGYKVEKPKELQNAMFYQALALGDVDYWANGWFPMHNSQMPDNLYEKAETVGYVMKSGGLQGYLVSKKAAEKFNIQSLEDFKRPEVKKYFDSNRDGKADLMACEPGWACAATIKHHMDVYELKDHINPVTATYTASMADAMARHKNDKPIFFYTWAPNWTIHKLKPGEDVVWINVPKIIPREVQKGATDRMVAKGIEGAISDPVKLGFIAADIRVVANKKFLAKNPAAKKFFELFELPLSDVNEQNTRMQDGEKSQKEIEQHAQEWIKNNKTTWDAWLAEARKAAM